MEVPQKTSVYVWGLGQTMYLGNKEKKSQPLPFRVKELDNKGVVAVSTGNFYTIVVTKGGQVYGWGNAKNARFGIEGEMIVSPQLIKELRKIKIISAGNWHSMALDDGGNLFACGHNSYGALGLGHLDKVTKFEALKNLSGIVHVSCGDGTSFFLNPEGTLYSCGHKARNGFGKDQHEPTPKVLMKNVKTVNAGFTHTAIITNQGKAYTFGDNTFLQLGLGKGVSHASTPKLVPGLDGVQMAQISCSRGEKNNHTCATDVEGRVYTWGSGYKGKLGHYEKWTHQDPADQPTPKLLETVKCKMQKALAGGIHSCFLSVQGQVYSCGCGSDGRLGHPQSLKYTYLYREGVPKLVEAFKGQTVISLSSSYYHNAAVAKPA